MQTLINTAYAMVRVSTPLLLAAMGGVFCFQAGLDISRVEGPCLHSVRRCFVQAAILIL